MTTQPIQYDLSSTAFNLRQLKQELDLLTFYTADNPADLISFCLIFRECYLEKFSPLLEDLIEDFSLNSPDNPKNSPPIDRLIKKINED